ncbi:MAG: M23 family metallopeptidase [Bdellovibrionales bacterium]|nr:M23 family metallopeptidase [Bdellovibrionales bacterium]
MISVQTKATSNQSILKENSTITTIKKYEKKEKITFHNLRYQDSLQVVLKKHGFTDSQVNKIAQQNILEKGFSLIHGNQYRVRENLKDHFLEIKVYEPLRNISYIFWRLKENAGCEKRKENFRVAVQNFFGEINGSIIASIKKILPNEWVAWRFLDAYSLDDKTNLAARIQRGSKFSFSVETKWDREDLIGYGDILQTTLEISNKIEKRQFFRVPGGGTFLNPENVQIDRPLYSPVNYLRISSYFEPNRMHPIKRKRQPHLGVDFELPEGTEVFSAESGRVTRIGYNRAAGNFIVVQHLNNLTTYYDHLDWVDPNLNIDSVVIRGQKLARVGCTGYCTRSHLHFAVKKNGQYINPLKLLKSFTFGSQQFISLLHMEK